MFNLLEGDGLIENIYHLLWTKDSVFGTDPFIIMPHTIIFKYQKPCFWYFTSVIDGKLKKKSASNLEAENIKRVFTKKVSKTGIIATFIYRKKNVPNKYHNYDVKNKQSTFDQDKQDYDSKNNQIFNHDNDNYSHVIEYLDLPKFEQFLDEKNSIQDGILQKFEDPKGEHNFLIRLVWSPKICTFEKKINKHVFHDKRFNIYERAVTFDGEEFQTISEPIRGSNLPDRLEKIGFSIASHVANVTLDRIKIVRMVLNFKITSDDKISFLWCSSLRIDNTLDKKIIPKNTLKYKECDTKKIQVFAPESVNLFKYNISGRTIKPIKDSKCLNCEKEIESYLQFEISYRTLIEANENKKKDKEYYKKYQSFNRTSTGVEVIPYVENKTIMDEDHAAKKTHYRNILIPKIIAMQFPKMKYEDYLILKKDSLFLEKATYCCESCYLDITQYCNIAGIQSDNLTNVLRQEVTTNKGMFGSKKNHKTNSMTNIHNLNNNNNNLNNIFGQKNKDFLNDMDFNKLQLVPFTAKKKMSFETNIPVINNKNENFSNKNDKNSSNGDFKSVSDFTDANSKNNNKFKRYNSSIDSKLKRNNSSIINSITRQASMNFKNSITNNFSNNLTNNFSNNLSNNLRPITSETSL